MNNEQIARLLFSHKLAGREQIVNALKMVSPETNVAEILVRQGLLTRDLYQKLMTFIENNQSPAKETKTEVKTKVEPQEEVDLPPVIECDEEVILEELPEFFKARTGFGQLHETIPETLTISHTMNEIFCYARKMRASDVHICPGTPILLRRFGKLIPVTESPLQQAEIEKKMRLAFTSEIIDLFIEKGDMEFIHTIEGGGRYRVTLMRESFGFDLTARVVPMKIMSFEESGMPEVCKGLTKWAQGLVLLTGPIGCGKSSSMAVLVDMINRTKSDHIICIESPIELVYQPSKCQITQRELNTHTLSQDNALRAALRQDPDILVISELRDLKSIQLAVSAAETGHLVFATMNTANAMRTIYRLIDSFPPEEQGIIRNMVSLSLRGVVSQQLIPKKDGTGVVPAYEVLVVTTAISNLIRKNSSHLLESAMITGKSHGMVLLDDSLDNLYKAGVIDGKEAYYRSINQKRFLAVKDK